MFRYKWVEGFEFDLRTAQMNFLWDSNFGYYETAEEIAQHLDNQSTEYPDKRIITLMDENHDIPRTFIVYAETKISRRYSSVEKQDDER